MISTNGWVYDEHINDTSRSQQQNNQYLEAMFENNMYYITEVEKSFSEYQKILNDLSQRLGMSTTEIQVILDKKVKSLESLNTFPLIGAAAITIILTFGIFSIIGDLINVI